MEMRACDATTGSKRIELRRYRSEKRRENTVKSRSLIIKSPFPFSANKVVSSELLLREKATSESKRRDSPPAQERSTRNKGDA